MWLRRLIRLLVPIASIVVLFVIWDRAVSFFQVPQYIMPTPGQAIDAIRAEGDTVRDLTFVTLRETVYGFLLGAGVGFVLAILMGQIPIVQRVLYPVLITTQAVPIVAIAAPLVLLLGFEMKPKLVIVGLFVFFPVVVNVVDGLAHVDPDLMKLARAVGGKPIRVFLLIRLPATLSPLFSGLKIGATYAVTGAVIGEWTASTTSGLGNYLLTANSQLNAARVYGVTLLLTAIGISSFLAMVVLERLVTPWQTRSTARRLPWRRRKTRTSSGSALPAPPSGVVADYRMNVSDGGER